MLELSSKLSFFVSKWLLYVSFLFWRFFLPIAITSFHCRRSPITKWATLITQERFEPASPNFTPTSVQIWPISVPDMTWQATSGWLQNVTEYCTTVLKTGPAGEESNNSAPVWRKITTNDTHNICRDFQVVRIVFPLALPIGGLLVSVTGNHKVNDNLMMLCIFDPMLVSLYNNWYCV